MFDSVLKSSVKNLISDEFKQRVIEEDPKMIKFIPLLKEMNEKGFLTFDSQPGIYRKKSNEHQRSYIIGFMKKRTAEIFLKRIRLTDKNAVIIQISNDVNYDKIYDILLTIENDRPSTSMSLTLPKEIYDFEFENSGLQKDLREKIVMIFLWDSKWNRKADLKNGLFTNVLENLF